MTAPKSDPTQDPLPLAQRIAESGEDDWFIVSRTELYDQRKALATALLAMAKRAERAEAERDALVKALGDPDAQVARCCSWCEQPYTNVTTLNRGGYVETPDGEKWWAAHLLAQAERELDKWKAAALVARSDATVLLDARDAEIEAERAAREQAERERDELRAMNARLVRYNAEEAPVGEQLNDTLVKLAKAYEAQTQAEQRIAALRETLESLLAKALHSVVLTSTYGQHRVEPALLVSTLRDAIDAALTGGAR